MKKDEENPGTASKFINKLVEVFAFGIYIRTALEAFQGTLLSSIQEVKAFEHTSIKRVFSLAYAVIML